MKIVEERDGSKMTLEFEEMTPEKRPQDLCGDGTPRRDLELPFLRR
jgi:hypothetical protein